MSTPKIGHGRLKSHPLSYVWGWSSVTCSSWSSYSSSSSESDPSLSTSGSCTRSPHTLASIAIPIASSSQSTWSTHSKSSSLKTWSSTFVFHPTCMSNFFYTIGDVSVPKLCLWQKQRRSWANTKSFNSFAANLLRFFKCISLNILQLRLHPETLDGWLKIQTTILYRFGTLVPNIISHHSSETRIF